MQSYVTAERLTLGGQLPSPQPPGSASAPQAATTATPDSPLIDQLLGRLADLVVDRLMARSGTETEQPPHEWMDARAAAVYLGVHRDTLRKLAAERAVPVHQDGPGCKLYFRRDELDDWRRSGRAPRSQLRAVA
jgi:excisionase family DNA binding protein